MAFHAEADDHEIPCPRCGAEAAWQFTDPAKSRTQIICPNCKRFEMSREDFDQATTENADLTGPE